MNNVFGKKDTNSGFFVVVVKTATMDDKGGKKSEGKPKTEMDKEAAARIQSAEAKKTTVKLKKEPLPPALSVRQTRMKQRRTKKGNEPESDNKP